ncbi:MAG: sugar ABC transporter permease [Caldilinea sp. CFX5]|nr:sugar ABC transporter permease [Caldilinea sp. CFX5]
MAAITTPRPRRSATQSIDTFWGYLFIAAPLLGFLIFSAGPLIASVVLSFFSWDLLRPPRWVGLENWQELFLEDPLVWKAMGNTAFLLLGIPISLLLAVFLASLMNQPVPGRQAFRVIYYLPTVLPVAALALLWLWLLNPDYGLVNNTLRALGLPVEWTRLNWWQDRALVKPALIIMGIWRGVGYQALVYVAALQSVPRQLYEAAEMDGANNWHKFWAVTWPILTPTTFFLLITALIGGFQIFVEPAIMTNGGPANESLTMVMLIWRSGFRDFSMGYAAAQAWLLGVIIMAITILNFVLARRWVFTENG